MKHMALDTPPEIERIIIEGYRRMPVWRQLQQVRELNRITRRLTTYGGVTRKPMNAN